MTSTRPGSPNSGPHQVLLAIYAVFALSAGARSAVQLATKGDQAPLPYWLSLLAALTYAGGWWAIRRAASGDVRPASVLLWVELAGVLTVGTASLVEPGWFPDATVWSDFGIGYGFVPAVLPLAGLLWLRSRDPDRGDVLIAAFRVVAIAEALSWAGLLAGMFAKYVIDVGEQGVEVFGPIHGAVFMAYLVVALLAWGRLRWTLPIGLLALASSIPPFCTLLFELWVDRSGRLESRAPALPQN